MSYVMPYISRRVFSQIFLSIDGCQERDALDLGIVDVFLYSADMRYIYVVVMVKLSPEKEVLDFFRFGASSKSSTGIYLVAIPLTLFVRLFLPKST